MAYYESKGKKAIKKSYHYTDAGMEQLLLEVSTEGHFVMEFTGTYHLRLLHFLQQKKRLVSVVAGEQIRYFSKMKNNLNKTDGQDAVFICDYAQMYHPDVFPILEEESLFVKQKRTYLNGLYKQKMLLENQLEAFSQYPSLDKLVVSKIDEMLSLIKAQILEVEKELDMYLQTHHKDVLKKLQELPSVGEKTAHKFVELASGFQNLKKDTQGKAFIKYVGLSPTSYQSGTSVKRKSKLSRACNKSLRQVMFMPILGLCTKEKIKKENIFKKYYIRLINRGKSTHQAMMAVMHKVVRVMLAIFKTGESFNEERYGKLPEKA